MFRILSGTPRPPQPGGPPSQPEPSPLRILVIIAVAAFVAELGIMLVFASLPPLPDFLEAVVDATMLVLVLSPVLIRFGFQPLLREIRERRRVEHELRELSQTMEAQVIERTRALDVTLNISRRLSMVLDPQQLVTEVVEQVREAFHYYHVNIYLFDETRQNLALAGSSGEIGRTLLARGHQVPLAQGPVGRAALTGQAVMVADTARDRGWLPNPLLPDTRAEVAIPITAGGVVEGVLQVQQNVVGGLSQVDADLLTSVANQVGVALRNAQTYEAARHQAAVAAMVNAISLKIQTAPNVEGVLEVAARELGQALGARRVAAQLGAAPAARPPEAAQ